MRTALRLSGLLACAAALNGCFLFVVGGAGAEGGYVAAQKDRTSGETVSDQWIHTKVATSLVSHSKVKSSGIDITVFKGVVTLKGSVTSESERATAVSLAKSIDGVTEVVDKLVVSK